MAGATGTGTGGGTTTCAAVLEGSALTAGRTTTLVPGMAALLRGGGALVLGSSGTLALAAGIADDAALDGVTDGAGAVAGGRGPTSAEFDTGVAVTGRFKKTNVAVPPIATMPTAAAMSNLLCPRENEFVGIFSHDGCGVRRLEPGQMLEGGASSSSAASVAIAGCGDELGAAIVLGLIGVDPLGGVCDVCGM